MDRSYADSFPCPRCGDRIPVEAGAIEDGVRRALCPSCKELLLRPADRDDSPWQLQD